MVYSYNGILYSSENECTRGMDKSYKCTVRKKNAVEQRSPTFLAPGTGFMEDSFSTDQGEWRGGGCSGGNASDGEQQTKLRLLAHRLPPAVRPGS